MCVEVLENGVCCGRGCDDSALLSAARGVVSSRRPEGRRAAMKVASRRQRAVFYASTPLGLFCVVSFALTFAVLSQNQDHQTKVDDQNTAKTRSEIRDEEMKR